MWSEHNFGYKAKKPYIINYLLFMSCERRTKMTKTNLTFAQAITNGELAYYYFLYEITQDFNCEKCVFKMGYDPAGDVFCYGQCCDSYKQAVEDYKRGFNR